MTKKARPPFVKHLIVLLILFNLFFVSLPILCNITNPALVVWDILLVAGVVVAVYGLWKMKRWARKVAIGVVIASILSGAVILGLLVFYRALRNLTKPETKLAFGEKSSRR